MEKQQPGETATKDAGSTDTKLSEDSALLDRKSPEPVATEKPLEKDPPKEEEKSEKKGSDEASEKEKAKPLEEDAKPEKKKEGDEPERKSKEDDPDETVEEFEDAVDTVGEPDDIELPDHFRSDGGCSSTRSSRRSSRRDSDGAVSSDENLPRLRVTESETYEIESSPEKSPKTSRRRSTSEEESKPTPRPGPSKVKSHEDIETVDLDDDEDDYDEDRSFEEDEDDYYDDPESDDQEVNRVIQEAVDEIDAMDNPESGEEDKMDVSSDEEDDDEDYSDDDDDRQRSIVVSKRSDKRKRGSDYSEGEIYDADDGDDYDQVGEVDEPEGGFRPPESREASLGRISLDDSDEEQEVESPKKKVGGKVKYKSYNQKLVAGIRKRTFKILNKRSSMHVMDEGSDAATLVCSSDATAATTAAKVVSLTTSSSSSSKSPAAPEEARKPVESPKEAVAVSDLDTSKKQVVGDENKENMTVKDNTPAVTVVEEEVKAVKDDGKRKKKREESEEDVMSGMMDDLDGDGDCTYRNGSKTEDFNDELTFQMDVDGGGGGAGEGSQKSEDTEGEDDREEGAVDLSSSTEAVNKQPVELVESSPEKEVAPVRQPEVPDLSVEKVVKVEPVEQAEEQRREESSVDLSSKTSPKEKPQPEKPVSRKRRRSVEEYEDEEDAEPLVPSKKLKRELECNFRAHDRLLKEYIETTSNDSMEDVQKNTELLMVEIQTLNDMIRAKENEWNNMIHLKKVKEEILMRLTRKKNVLNLVHTKLGEEPPADYSLSNVRSASVGPRPPTPPPEVDIRPASVTPLHNSRQSANTSTNDSSRQRLSQSGKDHHSSLFAQFNHINSSVTMVPLSTSPSLITSTNTILQSRANMKPSELAKEKPNAAQIQRQILPKPILSNHQQILNNLAMSAGLTAATSTNPSPNNSISTSTNSITAAAALAANNILANLGLSAQAAALLNGHHNPQQQSSNANPLQIGRQGVIKDVKSIIADYRQKHPEQVPRRGRRLKNIPSSAYDGMKGGSSTDQRMRELSFLLAAAERSGGAGESAVSSLGKGGAYPEVTLHPVMNSNSTAGAGGELNLSNGQTATSQHSQQSANNSSSSTSASNSLLHGILTKSASRPNPTPGAATAAATSGPGFTSFSPTLARLLTAPERMNSAAAAAQQQAATVTSGALANLQATTGLNLSKSNSEITITPVGGGGSAGAGAGSNSSIQQSLLQAAAAHQQLQEQQKQLQRLREQHFMNMDDEAEDSVDRLVIDEGDDGHHDSGHQVNHHGGHGHGHQRSAANRESSVVITTRGHGHGSGNNEFHENDVPECQGCKKREAQFVCAGCGNQWYCSRECQVNAWDDHSEVCTG